MPPISGMVTSLSTMSISPLSSASRSSASTPFDCGSHGEAARLEHARDRLPRGFVVVHYQDRLTAHAVAASDVVECGVESSV